ncbi:MAG TPA: SDR family NAD(P)-dependent oxidoreductase [Chloroflexota bacterium]|nr:SDR family NAD(P)-dependent oxidoreductase [Chloroflexota bacterium]
MALVTGASRGIGQAVALELARAGAAVGLIARDPERLASVAGTIQRLGGRAALCMADFERPGEAEAAAKVCQEFLGPIDVLVNNAGESSRESIENLTDIEWRRVFQVNLDAAFELSRAVLPGMRARHWGRIVNIASISGQTGGVRGSVVYASSKGALIAFTKALARDVGGDGVTVNAVAPGQVATEMGSNLTAEQLRDLTAQIPVRRLGRPDEIASAVRFLASAEAGYVTGATIDINGGLSRR